MELGQFNKTALLTGAGFSKNWGGLLASEVWDHIFGHSAVRARSEVQALLKSERSFEVALAIARKPPFTAADVAAIEAGIVDAFASMDRTFRDAGRWSVASSTINDFVSRFCPGPVGQATGYYFTVNQDLLPERIHGTIPDKQVPIVRGVRFEGMSPRPPTLDDIPIARPIDFGRDGFPVLPRSFNQIKLHGSSNWRTNDGVDVLVMGTSKTQTIAESPLLAWGFDVFKNVLFSGGVRLMVLGYSWSDEHVNRVIAEGVQRHGLKVFCWDIKDPRDVLPTAPHGAVIFDKGFLGKSSGKLTEVMPANPYNPITEEYKRVVREFFG